MQKRSFKSLMLNFPNLRWRIVVILLIVSLLPLALVGGGSWIVFGRLLENKTLELMHALMQRHAHSIETHLSEKLDVTSMC